jgi:hypothetical protein
MITTLVHCPSFLSCRLLLARDNFTRGQKRIANELLLKLGLRVSPRTVRKYTPPRLDRAPGHRVPSQRWRTFLRNHARGLIISGVSMDLTRGVQAVAARLIWLLQSWRDRSGMRSGGNAFRCARTTGHFLCSG